MSMLEKALMSTAVELAQVEIDKAQKELEAKLAELARLEKLTALFPDIERYEGRWKRVVYRSALVNERATDVFFRYNCGCCSDSPLEAWPFVKTEHGDVFSSPAYFFVGERHWIAGAKPNERWEAEFREARLPEVIIERVRFEVDRLERIAIASEDGPDSSDPEPLI